MRQDTGANRSILNKNIHVTLIGRSPKITINSVMIDYFSLYSLINSFVLLTVSIGRTNFSISSRLGSRNGGNDNFSPSVS